MVEEKRASVKFLVLDTLKGKSIEGTKKVPLYTQVVYDSKNTKFKTIVNKEPVFVTKDFDFQHISNKDLINSLNKHEEQIVKIVEYETKKFKSRFTLKGLQKRIGIYDTEVISIFNAFTTPLDDLLKETMIYNNYLEFKGIESAREKLNYLSMYEKKNNVKILDSLDNVGVPALASSSLFEAYLYGYQDPPVITCYDWLIGNEDKIYDDVYDQIIQKAKAESLDVLKFLAQPPGVKSSDAITSLLDVILSIYLK